MTKEKLHFGAWWLPFLSAIAIASTPIVVAVITANATREGTDKDYVGLAVSILSSDKSSKPSRRWAAQVLSKMSPVAIPPELASGLVTGEDVLQIVPLPCLNQLSSSGLLDPTPGAPLPTGNKVGDLGAFADAQTGQLDKANIDKRAAKRILAICTKAVSAAP